jgi:hypothetical protein
MSLFVPEPKFVAELCGYSMRDQMVISTTSGRSMSVEGYGWRTGSAVGSKIVYASHYLIRGICVA